MINLIPPEGHRAARREYYARVVGSIGFLLAGIFICLSVGMIPMYVLISAQISGLEVNLESKDAGMTLQQARDEVKVIKSILTQLQTTDQQVLASTIIAEI